MDFRRNNVNTSKKHKWDFNEVPWAKKEQFWALIFPLGKWGKQFHWAADGFSVCVWASTCLCKCVVRSYHTKTQHAQWSSSESRWAGDEGKVLRSSCVWKRDIYRQPTYIYNTQICKSYLSLFGMECYVILFWKRVVCSTNTVDNIHILYAVP